MLGQYLLGMKYRTLIKHMVHGLTVGATQSWNLVWADLVYSN